MRGKSTWPRRRHSSLLLAPAVFLFLIVLLLVLGIAGPSLMEMLLPDIGAVFDPRPAGIDPAGPPVEARAVARDLDGCELIAGPARDFCGAERGAGPDIDAAEAVLILPAVAGIGALWVAAGRRR
ncbi:hypothetical protein [Streptomyces xinghaiensis]|uniref:hypothetical protein n=1 Tax=Streptomyces xinghaiensis TaxID=1038928 RepID=UPI0012FF774A|nr:hypothetical protein [Streptomyces xinghaiensis]MZE76735.1 hypothetical protein [Streptomyces sp. SID5475]